ncbi:MAG: hypothetical protein EBZ59_01085 [Planctomycetia bacterium]|nr:hypothetical protein [Planctomycetia bacterium]
MPRSAAAVLPLIGFATAAMIASAGDARGDGVATADRRTLTAAEARELVQGHEGPLDLSGVRVLDPDVAVILGAYPGDLLLDGLQTLSVEAATALAAHAGDAEGQVDAEAIAARVSEAFEAGDLDEERIMQIIGEFEGSTEMPLLSLGGLTSLDPDVAGALAGHLGSLALDGLRSVGVESARALAGHVGLLSLSGLEGAEALPDEVVDALAAHVGEIMIPEQVLAAIPDPSAGTATTAPDAADPRP